METDEYREMLAWIFRLESRGVKLGLDRIASAAERRGHPERARLCVHVAGTNGKGSVCAMLEAMLRSAGYRTGLFTSPHLHQYTERIRLDGVPVARDRLLPAARTLRHAMESGALPQLSFYEFTTLLGFELFSHSECEIVIYEVGMGGLLDATNLVDPLLSVITRIGFDHTKALGATLAEIAAQKAGIIKPGRPVVAGMRDPEASKVVRDRARDLECPLLLLGDDFELEASADLAVRVHSERYDSLRSALRGRFQHDNIACAVAAAALLRPSFPRLDAQAVRRGLAAVRWPGRMEAISAAGIDTEIWMDGAHNPDGCQALASFVRELEQKPTIVIFAGMADKDLSAMLRVLSTVTEDFVYPPLPLRRAALPDDLAGLQPGRVVSSVAAALDFARARAGSHGRIVVAGSLFLLAEARATLLGIETDLLIPM